MPSDLLIFLVNKGLDSTRGLQELFIVFPDFLLQLLFFKSPEDNVSLMKNLTDLW